MRHFLKKFSLASMLFICASAFANDKKIELETLKIQGNKELPKMLFIVPWKSSNKSNSKSTQQKLVLHSLYGDLFDPATPKLDKAAIARFKQGKTFE